MRGSVFMQYPVDVSICLRARQCPMAAADDNRECLCPGCSRSFDSEWSLRSHYSKSWECKLAVQVGVTTTPNNNSSASPQSWPRAAGRKRTRRTGAAAGVEAGSGAEAGCAVGEHSRSGQGAVGRASGGDEHEHEHEHEHEENHYSDGGDVHVDQSDQSFSSGSYNSAYDQYREPHFDAFDGGRHSSDEDTLSSEDPDGMEYERGGGGGVVGEGGGGGWGSDGGGGGGGDAGGGGGACQGGGINLLQMMNTGDAQALLDQDAAIKANGVSVPAPGSRIVGVGKSQLHGAPPIFTSLVRQDVDRRTAVIESSDGGPTPLVVAEAELAKMAIEYNLSHEVHNAHQPRISHASPPPPPAPPPPQARALLSFFIPNLPTLTYFPQLACIRRAPRSYDGRTTTRPTACAV